MQLHKGKTQLFLPMEWKFPGSHEKSYCTKCSFGKAHSRLSGLWLTKPIDVISVDLPAVLF